MVTNPNYIFWPEVNDRFLNVVEFPNYFSPQECDDIIKLGLEAETIQATISQNKVIDTKYRDSKISWLECLYSNDWLWHKINNIILEVNAKYYKYKLLGFRECLQFTQYLGPGTHYNWHMDFGPGTMSIRKLSAVVQLSDEKDYRGGSLELLYGADPFFANKTRGTIIIFPSFTMHRVAPISSGKRYSLVLWASGHEPYR